MEICGLDMNNTAYHQAHSIAQTIVENNNKTFLQDMKDIEASVLAAIEEKNSEDDTYSTHSMNSDSLSSVTPSLKSENSEMMKTMLSMQEEIKSLKLNLKTAIIAIIVAAVTPMWIIQFLFGNVQVPLTSIAILVVQKNPLG